MKKKLKAALHQRHGISIVEAAVALAIIMLISAVTMSLVTIASRVDGEAAYITEINEYVESTLDCFRWADNSVDFGKAVAQFGFKEKEADPDIPLEDVYEKWYVLERSDYCIELRVNYPNEYEINAEDANGEEIYRFIYGN